MGLRKSHTDKKLAGVCGGIGESWGIDPTLVRVIFVLATVFAIGSPILIYIILALVMPD